MKAEPRAGSKVGVRVVTTAARWVVLLAEKLVVVKADKKADEKAVLTVEQWVVPKVSGLVEMTVVQMEPRRAAWREATRVALRVVEMAELRVERKVAEMVDMSVFQ